MGVLDELRTRQPVTRTVTLYLDTAAVSEVQRLRDEGRARLRAPSLKDPTDDPELVAASEAMEASARTFTFGTVPAAVFEGLVDEYPNGEGGFDVQGFPPALVAAAATNPPLTLDEAVELREIVSKYEWESLFGAAFEVQTVRPRPFTKPATAPTLRTASESNIA